MCFDATDCAATSRFHLSHESCSYIREAGFGVCAGGSYGAAGRHRHHPLQLLDRFHTPCFSLIPLFKRDLLTSMFLRCL